MENKNVFIAIALSMSVLLFWSAFVDPPQAIDKQNQKISNSQTENRVTDGGIVPNIDGTVIQKNISREDSLKKTNRIFLENTKILHLSIYVYRYTPETMRLPCAQKRRLLAVHQT